MDIAALVTLTNTSINQSINQSHFRNDLVLLVTFGGVTILFDMEYYAAIH